MAAIYIPRDPQDKWLQEGIGPAQPKSDVADIIQANGFNVPPRFTTEEEAKSSWAHGYHLRSEHPLEYAGPSDMFPTAFRQPYQYENLGEGFDLVSWKDFVQGHTSPKQFQRIVDAYCLEIDDFLNDLSFSVWGHITGANRFMFQDPADPNKYFVGTCIKDREFMNSQYGVRAMAIFMHSITKDGDTKTLFRDSSPSLPDWIGAYGSPADLIEFYEGIRNVEAFNPQHIPIIEFQSDHLGQQWFLQYHRGRNPISVVDFRIPRDAKDGFTRFKTAIGATPEVGVEIDVAIAWADGLDLNTDYRAHELELVARSNVPVLLSSTSTSYTFEAGIADHGPRSTWAKSPLVLFHEAKTDQYKGVANLPVALTRNADVVELTPGLEVMFARMHVISDGRSAIARQAKL